MQIVPVNPFRCRMWHLHPRLDENITEESCRAQIESTEKHGQLVPALGRRVRDVGNHTVELIYGARRLFAARHLNQPLLVELRDISDRDALIAMDIENRLRQDISSYERGQSYARWLREGHFLQSGAMLYYPLNTGGAFHSRFMSSAQEQFRAYLKQFRFATPKIPVIANVSALPYGEGDIVENLSNQVSSTVRWCESIQHLMKLGASRGDQVHLEEIGPGDVLTKIANTIKLQSPDLAMGVSVQERVQPAAAAAAAATEMDADREPSRAQAAEQPAAANQSAAEKVAAWNGRYPVGTRVRSLSMDCEGLETRTSAVLLFGHRAAVYMKGYNGYFDLDELAPL